MIEDRDFALDPHRPTFHFLPPANWMNDPNGLIHWKGKYHLFYQYNPNGAFHATMHWGHAWSDDLVHWEHLPIALAPSPEGPDADGCYSGCAVDVNGIATFMYTGVRGSAQLPCIATSQDDDLVTWEKYSGNPVIGTPPPELNTTIFRDHTVWREGGLWYQAIGSGVEGVGGTAVVFRSADFLNWQYVDSLVALERVSTGVGEGATGWECPDFFPLENHHVLTVSMWDHKPLCVAYFVGRYADNRFVPEHEGVVDHGVSFYAPQSFTDALGRRVMFGWVRESRSVDAQINAGWSGVMSLPRVLSVLDDGSLGTAPAPEVERLRGESFRLLGDQVSPQQDVPLGNIPGDAFELRVRLAPDVTGTVNLEVLRSEDGSERTQIVYDADTQTLTIDTRQASKSHIVDGGNYSLQSTGQTPRAVEVHVFVDHSIVEVFLNDEKCITARAYPTTPKSDGVRISASGGTTSIDYVDVWSMNGEQI